MNFDDVSINNYLQFSPALDAEWHVLTDADNWETEARTCIFYVVSVANYGSGDDDFQIDCVKDCGGHSISTINRKYYDTISIELGRDMCTHVDSIFSGSELFTPPDLDEEDTYSLEEEIEYILSLITEGHLPSYRSA